MREGGERGSAGYRYQELYAVSTLIQAAALAIANDEPADFSVMEQGHCFVDDVIVCIDDDYFIFCQLKTSDDGVTWSARHHKLEDEFTNQMRLNERSGIDQNRFELKLISPHERRVRLLRGAGPGKPRIPPALRAVTEVELFPLELKPSRLIQAYLPLRQALDTSCAIASNSSLRGQLFAAFLAVWKELSDTGALCSCREIMEMLYEQALAPFRGSGARVVDAERWAQALTFLQQHLPELKIELRDGYCHYSYRFRSGFVPIRCDSPSFGVFIKLILSARPMTIDEFWELTPT